MPQDQTDFVMERMGKISEMDRSLDIAYWQRLGPQAILEAAWKMVEEAHQFQGKDPSELRLCRTVEKFGKLPG